MRAENSISDFYPDFIIEDLNHLFMPSVYGNTKKSKQEYKVAQNVDKQVLDDLSDWIFSV